MYFFLLPSTALCLRALCAEECLLFRWQSYDVFFIYTIPKYKYFFSRKYKLQSLPPQKRGDLIVNSNGLLCYKLITLSVAKVNASDLCAVGMLGTNDASVGFFVYT